MLVNDYSNGVREIHASDDAGVTVESAFGREGRPLRMSIDAGDGRWIGLDGVETEALFRLVDGIRSRL